MLFSSSLAFLILAVYTTQPAFADDAAVAAESAAEAEVIYNLALLTEWPDLPANEFRICVLGSEPMLAAMEPIKKRHLKKLPITVTDITSSRQAQSCEILFVGQPEHPSIGKLTSQISNEPIMIVSEGEDFDPKDVIILLVDQPDRIAFKINGTAARTNSLLVSSKLLKLALQVY